MKIVKSRDGPGSPAVGICDCCGGRVTLYGSFDCRCKNCGAEYNLFGQRLAPRSQWGYETGETLSDIVGPRREDPLGIA